METNLTSISLYGAVRKTSYKTQNKFVVFSTQIHARVIVDCGVVLFGALANTNTNRCLKSWIIHGAMLR